MKTRSLVGGTPVNLRYLACCLRLGDIVDFDRTRTPLSALHSIHFTESISVEEWNKHLSVDGVIVTPDRVTYETACETPADYVAGHHFLDWVDRELQDATRIVREFPQDLADRYQLNIAPVVDRYQVTMADPWFIAGGFRFQLEYDQIMKLLMDKSLRRCFCGNSSRMRSTPAAISRRERTKRKRRRSRSITSREFRCGTAPGCHAGQITRTRVRESNFGTTASGCRSVRSRTSSCGSAKNYYRSADFRAERERLAEMGIHLDACSLLGIGFLSCFLGGDRIVVETFQYGSQPLRITIEGSSKYFVIEQLPEVDLADFPAFSSPGDPEDDSPPNCSGTKVTVYLRKDWRRNPSEDDGELVFKTLDKYAVNQEFPILVYRPEKETREIAERRWDRQAPALNLKNGETSVWADFLVPSVFELSDYHEQLRARGAIWFLADYDGKPVLQLGELRIQGDSIRESTFIGAVRSIIDCRASAH